MDDLSGRLDNRVQISSDALSSYVDAVERAFGAEWLNFLIKITGKWLNFTTQNQLAFEVVIPVGTRLPAS